ncbi:UNVERIFIED_CONTAM: hypothetical protein RMT77_013619 [Armadillidium vulgare]
MNLKLLIFFFLLGNVLSTLANPVPDRPFIQVLKVNNGSVDGFNLAFVFVGGALDGALPAVGTYFLAERKEEMEE